MLVAFRATVLVRPKSPEERRVRGLLGAHGLGTEYVPHPGPVVIAHIILLHIPLAQYSGEETFDLEVSHSGIVVRGPQMSCFAHDSGDFAFIVVPVHEARDVFQNFGDQGLGDRIRPPSRRSRTNARSGDTP